MITSVVISTLNIDGSKVELYRSNKGDSEATIMENVKKTYHIQPVIDDDARDFSKYQCPNCGNQKASSYGRTCEKCKYNGDWIQPGETMTYKRTKM